VLDTRVLLLLVLILLALAFAVFWWRDLIAPAPVPASLRPRWIETAIGFVTDFLDTLGIGSFAVTTALYRWRALRPRADRSAAGLVPDGLLPGTLNVGHFIPTVLQAIIYISIIEVDLGTLVALIAAAVVGAHFGAGVVVRLAVRPLRIGLAIALLCAAGLTFARLEGLLPSGSDRLSLSGAALVGGVIANGVLGALMTLGIGLYGPCMILVALLGMNPKAAFPIMMGSCAFLMPVAARRFVRAGRYAPRAALGLTLGGLPGVWLAAQLVRELNLDAVRWLVIAVVTYNAISLLMAAGRVEQSSEPASGSPRRDDLGE
jgi:uncharacterized membrane protein YfcA